MFRKKSHTEEQAAPADDKLLTADHFRTEALEHAERAERARIEHRAQELGVTVAQLQAGIQPVVEEVPLNDAHIRESIRESEKASHRHH